MAEIKKYSPGIFCWTDLGTPDVKAAKKFYQAIFGWEFKDMPMGNDAFYSVCYVDGKEACAIYPQAAEDAKAGIPPNWLAYISVANVDEAAKNAKIQGGNVFEAPFDVMDAGRMALVKDPTGAAFALWQAKEHIGAGVYDHSGSVCWRELLTPNMDLAGKFYSKLFNWTQSSEKAGEMTYAIFKSGEEGVCGITSPKKEKTPPLWVTYWLVDDCDQSVEKAKSLGAKLIAPPTSLPGTCKFALLSDPQGVYFGVNSEL